MDENLCYSNDEEEDERRISSSQWHLDHDSLMSLERESSRLFLKYRNYHLYLIQRKEPPSTRRIIPATKCERLCYYRNFISSPNKIQIACLHQKNFNIFFWRYIFYALFKSLQHTFVNLFLASYVPEVHFYAAKMVPLMHGLKFSFILTGFLELLTMGSKLVLMLDYVIGSIFLKNPWNKCPSSGVFIYNINNVNVTVNCFNVMDFAERVQNKTVAFINHFYYIADDNEYLQLVQIEYFKLRINAVSGKNILVYIFFIWGILIFCFHRMFKRNFWKTYHILHWCVMSIDMVSFVYLVISYFNEETNVPDIESMYTDLARAMTISDIDFVSQSMTAPPVIHVLTSRSTQEILPGRDSAIIVLSNAVCFLFKALLSYRVQQHCQSLTRVPLMLPDVAAYAWLYFWPMYFSTFFLGDIYTLIFLLFHSAMEIMTTCVTFQCLVESIISEMPVNRWLVTVSLMITALSCKLLMPVGTDLILAYNKCTATLFECIVVYCMYPMYRLVDDIEFHYGTPVHFLRVQLLIVVPLYYVYKYLDLIGLTKSLLTLTEKKWEITYVILVAYVFMLVPVLLGMIYIIYVYILKNRKSWKSLFVPAEDWGPRNYNTRQLRKSYDSRTFNASGAPRSLSRHILSRMESKAYRLDIRYDPSRRSTVPNYEFNPDDRNY